jgi:hypothetical protein
MFSSFSNQVACAANAPVGVEDTDRVPSAPTENVGLFGTIWNYLWGSSTTATTGTLVDVVQTPGTLETVPTSQAEMQTTVHMTNDQGHETRAVPMDVGIPDRSFEHDAEKTLEIASDAVVNEFAMDTFTWNGDIVVITGHRYCGKTAMIDGLLKANPTVEVCKWGQGPMSMFKDVQDAFESIVSEIQNGCLKKHLLIVDEFDVQFFNNRKDLSAMIERARVYDINIWITVQTHIGLQHCNIDANVLHVIFKNDGLQSFVYYSTVQRTVLPLYPSASEVETLFKNNLGRFEALCVDQRRGRLSKICGWR